METTGESEFGTGDEFDGHGYRDTKHGYDYQLSQLMLSALRNLKLANGPFQLASDIRAADKWDDMVITRPMAEGEGRLFRFVQAKHVQDNNKKIHLRHLLSEKSKEPFSLQKYFVSYVQIKRNDVSLLKPRDSVEDLIILTNSGFAYGENSGALEMKEDVFENLGEDRCFSNNAMRFKPWFKGKDELVLVLKKGFVDMPHEFSLKVTSGKEYTNKIDSTSLSDIRLSSAYWKALNSEVLNDDGDKFLSKFIMGENLSQTARHFRQELNSRYQEDYGGGSEESFRRYLERIPIKKPKREHVDPKENSKRFKELAKKMARLLKDHRANKSVTITECEGDILRDFFLTPANGRFKIRSAFLRDEKPPGDLSQFKSIILHSGLKLDEFSEYTFTVANGGVRHKAPETAEELDFEVNEFLDKLKFVLHQPGGREMKEAILRELATLCGLEEKDPMVENVYNMLHNKFDEWMGKKSARFLTQVDLKKFFREREREVKTYRWACFIQRLLGFFEGRRVVFHILGLADYFL